ncbi:hypothetical protein ABZ532_21945 [Streptomyces sp. NPDC019396]|uniref:hypothetical protein n=1 Tax=Streptomyces sp. NPDC019396 TaxID=3154687 RepID=UPI0033C44745
MTLFAAGDLHRTAARAALAVRGVAGLAPGFSHRLAHAAARAQQCMGIAVWPPEAGIRAEHAPHAGGWHLEVRCILDEDRRALDTARDVRRQVRSAVTAHLVRSGSPEAVTVLVTITHTTNPAPSRSEP